MTRRDVPNEGKIPSLRSEGVAEAGASATVVQKPSKDTLASLKDDPKEEGTLSLVADDILTDARARTEILAPGLLPPMHEAPFERADTAILLAPPPPVIVAPSVPDVRSAAAPVAEARVAVAPSVSPPASDSGNLPLIIVSVVLFLIAAAIVVGSLSHG